MQEAFQGCLPNELPAAGAWDQAGWSNKQCSSGGAGLPCSPPSFNPISPGCDCSSGTGPVGPKYIQREVAVGVTLQGRSAITNQPAWAAVGDPRGNAGDGDRGCIPRLAA